MLPQTNELNFEQCRACLDELQPRIGHYGWMLSVLRHRSKRSGGLPSRVLRWFRQISNRNRPYFIGVTEDGTRFVGDFWDDYSVAWAVQPGYDRHVVEFLKEKSGGLSGTFLDIGANCGVLAATVGRHTRGALRVVAVEPMPNTAKRAAATIALNDLKDARVLTIALGDEEGCLELYQSPDNSGWTTAHPSAQAASGEGAAWTVTKVPSRLLDNLSAEGVVSDVRFIKLDVEGHEFSVLRGARELLRRDQPGLFYEYHPGLMKRAGWSREDVTGLLCDELGYEMKVMAEDGAVSEFPPPANIILVNVFCQAARDRARQSTEGAVLRS